jgi:CRP/FNR family transcriptional regulator, cyclic AMP receptor protein
MIQDFLRTVELFSDLEDDELAHVLMVAMVKRHRAGNVILTEGALGGHLHVIHQGSVRLSKHVPGAGEEALTILGPGEIFGETEFFDGLASSANVIAHTDCDVLAIPHDEVRSLMLSRPALTGKILWALGRTVARRVRESHRQMASLFAISRDF